MLGTGEPHEEEPEGSPSKKRKGVRGRTLKASIDKVVTYVIPEVERKQTNFRGRLGYACLNTILRAAKPDPIFCSRTCRLDTLGKKGIEFAKDLGLQNVRDLVKLIQWNEDNRIKFMRISSEIFPFASHLTWGYSLEYAAKELKEVGDLANKLGHRLTTHPGQFTQLVSPKPLVVEASVRELEYHTQMFELMGMGPDSVIIIHMGGAYGDKESALARFRESYTTKLSPSAKARLVLENDELSYNVDDLMPICDELDIPIVVDYHHDWINPSTRPLSELIPIVKKTWERKGIRPKQHLSSPKPGAVTVMERRAHANRCPTLPDELPEDMDLMIEAKDKEQAVLHLYRIYSLEPVEHANLRPEKPDGFAVKGETTVDETVVKESEGRRSRGRPRKGDAVTGSEERKRKRGGEAVDNDILGSPYVI
ncbi:hypothetical protein M422DRAFT_184685 [Sphaerobolus stellatus SS14]|uniref:UV-damage endonuclease n=1 Tax=Sphaerobolus stellatus (strain SS14) TaxID=990650 RepID=A0A0C9V483_SPHS4|nr:hypothetical protein M422DRAFT_184685 [Sphaerobolus stellatus SS14]